MYYDNNWKNKNPLCHPLTDDWFIWNSQIENVFEWNVCIKCYINMAEIIATNLRNNIGSNDNIYNILGFLFCIRQAIELELKQLNVLKEMKFKENHNLLDLYKNIKSSYDWKHFGIVEDNIVNALEFMQDKNEIFRYPYDKKNRKFEIVGIHLSDWLFLVHSFYSIITDEQERKTTNG